MLAVRHPTAATRSAEAAPSILQVYAKDTYDDVYKEWLEEKKNKNKKKKKKEQNGKKEEEKVLPEAQQREKFDKRKAERELRQLLSAGVR